MPYQAACGYIYPFIGFWLILINLPYCSMIRQGLGSFLSLSLHCIIELIGFECVDHLVLCLIPCYYIVVLCYIYLGLSFLWLDNIIMFFKKYIWSFLERSNYDAYWVTRVLVLILNFYIFLWCNSHFKKP